MSSVIKVENISKQYRLGDVGTGSLAHDVNRWWHKARGKEDPYLKIGEVNDRTVKGDSDYVWALRDINFDVEQGEVLGIIGRNGAGKSTLLKILSRTTTPTTGTIKIKGRVASLLEVGTGFHPELSGRENIFLNGAILGMTKKEIKNKFDEIVDFAGVERYIDTPVKRYSSGMYVRLAFGVAAHLEPEILIVDEVLAVGDTEFQKKALGKMKDVSSKDGRTVLFVSHNLPAIKQLCTKGLFLKNGLIDFAGDIFPVLEKYKSIDQHDDSKKLEVVYQNNFLNFLSLSVNNSEFLVTLDSNNYKIHLEIVYEATEECRVSLELKFFDELDVPIGFLSPSQETGNAQFCKKGLNKIDLTFSFPKRSNAGRFKSLLCLSDPGNMIYFEIINPFLIEYEGFPSHHGKTFKYDNNAGLLFMEYEEIKYS